MMTIANWIKTERHKLNLSQEELGTLVGCSQQRIQNYELDKRCPDLELLAELAMVFQSELRVGIHGIQVVSSNETVEFVVHTLGRLLTGDGYDDTLVEATQKLLEERIKPLLQGIHSPAIGFRLGGHFLTMEEWRALKTSPLERSLLGRELECFAHEVIRAYERSGEDCLPHELGGLGDFSCEAIFQSMSLEASVTVSLYSEATNERTWNWYLFSEVDGQADEVVFSAPYESLSGAEILDVLLEQTEEVLQLPMLQDMVRSHCQRQLLQFI